MASPAMVAVPSRARQPPSASRKRRKNCCLAGAEQRTVNAASLGVPAPAKVHVGRTMEAKRGEGLIFVNCMEKLTMNAPRETLRVRMRAALDAGIDGITLAAGLHLGSFALIEDHPRFRDARL